jgi:RNA polymerase sigma factor (sigma-70 family)
MRSPNQIILEIHRNPHYRQLCKKIARADLIDDLYQEFLLALLTLPDLPAIYQKEWFNYFCVRVITNLYKSKTSTFYRKYRHLDKTTCHVPDSPVYMDPEPDTTFDPLLVMQYMNSELEKMPARQRDLFLGYLNTRSARTLARETHLKQRTIARKIRQIRQQLREAVNSQRSSVKSNREE